MPSSKWEKKGLKEWDRETGKVKDVEDRRSEMYMVNQHSGQIAPTKYRLRKRIGRRQLSIIMAKDVKQMILSNVLQAWLLI